MSARLQSLRSTSNTAPTDSASSDERLAASASPRVNRKRGVSQVEPPNPATQPNTATTNTTTKKPRTTDDDGQVETAGQAPNQSAGASKRTRSSNNEHPALRPGVLTKLYEPREEIAARAAGRRAEGEAKKETKKAEHLEKKKKEETGKMKIAAAMNASEREMRERDEKSRLPFGGNVEVRAFNGGFDAHAGVRKDSTSAQTAPLTATEKKKLRTQNFLTDISEYRQREDGVDAPKTPSSTPTSRPRSTPSATTQPKKTLNNDWRLNIQPLQRDNHLGAATPLTSKTGSASKAKDKKLAKEKAKGAKGKARAVEESDDDDRDGALREKESGIEDEAVESFPGGTSGLDQFQVNIFEVDNDTLKPKTDSKTKKNKSDRRPKSVVSAKESLALETMPQWAQDNWWKLKATICDTYGEDSRPWKLGQGNDCRFLADVEAAVRNAVPSEADFKVTSTSDKVYRRCRQAIYEWREHFYLAAIELVNKNLGEVLDELGTEKMKVWVRNALSPDSGAAYWSVPGTEDKRARGSLRSEYIVEALATHLKNIKGSARPYTDKYPTGALALSCAAVQRCFEAWLPGVKPDAYPPFSKQNVSDLVEQYANGPSIQALVDKPHRFDDLIQTAFERLSAPEPPSKSIPDRMKASTHKAAVVIEPSSDAEPDEDDAGEVEDGWANRRDVESDGSDVNMHDGDDDAEERVHAGGGDITVKAEDLGEEYGFPGGLFYDDDGLSGPPSVDTSALTLEVDGLEIISLPITRDGSLEPQHNSRTSPSSASVLSLD